jgi:hypothetical protein
MVISEVKIKSLFYVELTGRSLFRIIVKISVHLLPLNYPASKTGLPQN